VSVLEGRVQVTPERQGSPAIAQTPAGQGASPPPALSAGEQVRIGADGRIEQRTAPGIADVAAWRQRRLVFREDSLTDMAAQIMIRPR
jgi:ferric-dicitrate binding protein FerR (iron transport regulator)